MRFLFALPLLAACAATSPPVLIPQVERGPAAGIRPKRVLVLRATCGSLEFQCPPQYIQTVNTIVRGGLEFAGYAVIDSESIGNEKRHRQEQHRTATTTTETHSATREVRTLEIDRDDELHHTETTTTSSSEIILDGPAFEDLSVAERHEVLAKSGADSIAVVRIVVGADVGAWMPNQNVEVMVKLGVNLGDDMAWAARCTASSNQFATVNGALEHAARCSVYGGTGK